MGGPEHSTLSNDANPGREFDFMLSNPPYGKSWKTDLERMGGKRDMRDPRFVIEHAGDSEYSLVTRSSDGQMLFLANKLSKMKQSTAPGSRIADTARCLLTQVQSVVILTAGKERSVNHCAAVSSV